MNAKPVIGLEAIHQKYFVSDSGEQIVSLGTLRRISKDMQAAKVITRKRIKLKNGKMAIRIIAIEPFFSLWRREFLCRNKFNARK
jgi:hypothetical protein